MPDRSISDELVADHAQIDALFLVLKKAVEGSINDARAAVAAFEAPLRAHMDWEEKALVPAVLRAAPVTYRRRTVDALFSDHEDIRCALNTLREEIGAARREGARETLEALRVLLAGHNRDEELGIYADADRSLAPEVREQILKELGIVRNP